MATERNEVGVRPPMPTKRVRRRLSTQYGYGHRPTNNWNEGSLPAPFAEGDLLWLDREYVNDEGRMRGERSPGWYVVCCAFSIDEGDAWYFRVRKAPDGEPSDRLHVAYPGRFDPTGWSVGFAGVDWMAPFELVDTSDQEGLARRSAVLGDGWSFNAPPRCPSCGQRLPASTPSREEN